MALDQRDQLYENGQGMTIGGYLNMAPVAWDRAYSQVAVSLGAVIARGAR